MDNFKIYTIRCLTNMHVGSGDASYTLIDNQVQRDVITGFPTINSSSLKGSLRSFLDPKKEKSKAIKYIFGDKEDGMGNYKIFPGMLLSMPVRSNVKPFFRATCPRIIKDFLGFIENFQPQTSDIKNIKTLEEDLKNIEKVADKNKNTIFILKNFNRDIDVKFDNNQKIEGIKITSEREISLKGEERIKEIFGESLILIDDNSFNDIVDRLPVIARNKLDNGESENLWYEEVVPRETRFYFGTILGKEHQSEFGKIEGKQPVQIGGNATIGYGYCDIKSI
ncbi:type III-B CRISPR module RAMP protein Cmr4 [Clostridium sporogenes]|uniref:type III-B CRISPR module RAMP protein Cmr4 n=1 Tax=Clostridium botulinum TaxID=1491 RepID=UPI000D116E11|nr:type III-B CRISPR module RAMP protein Cmr4 [Clostridium botulinum]AVQ46526.1 type III-B CRISPR module RAMP protein Cmr4 [Clostridium botulinum]AVQ50132.1 type III-B CRISPR module RAMP protein Cmr4 [Clostridium botulinum]